MDRDFCTVTSDPCSGHCEALVGYLIHSSLRWRPVQLPSLQECWERGFSKEYWWLDCHIQCFSWEQSHHLIELIESDAFFTPFIFNWRIITGGFPGGSDGKEYAWNGGDPGSNFWFMKIPWRREWLPTPVFLPGEFHGQRPGRLLQTVHGVAKSWIQRSD